MNRITTVMCAFGLVLSLQAQETIIVPASESIEYSARDYDVFMAGLKNRSPRAIEISVLSREDGEQVRGFELNGLGRADVMVEKENVLTFTNNGKEEVRVRVDVSEKDRSVFERKGEYVNFTLRNESMKSIPLIIPSVMNPNLSPMSNSRVALKMGQNIYFKKGGKKHLLLEVDDSIKEGEVLQIAALIKKRKAELGL